MRNGTQSVGESVALTGSRLLWKLFTKARPVELGHGHVLHGMIVARRDRSRGN